METKEEMVFEYNRRNINIIHQLSLIVHFSKCEYDKEGMGGALRAIEWLEKNFKDIFDFATYSVVDPNTIQFIVRHFTFKLDYSKLPLVVCGKKVMNVLSPKFKEAGA